MRTLISTLLFLTACSQNDSGPSSSTNEEFASSGEYMQQDDSSSSGGEYSLRVQMNIEEGRALVTDHGFGHNDAQVGQGCPLQEGYYTCDLGLQPGIYTIVFQDVAGYITPDVTVVQLEMDDVVVGDYSLR